MVYICPVVRFVKFLIFDKSFSVMQSRNSFLIMFLAIIYTCHSWKCTRECSIISAGPFIHHCSKYAWKLHAKIITIDLNNSFWAIGGHSRADDDNDDDDDADESGEDNRRSLEVAPAWVHAPFIMLLKFNGQFVGTRKKIRTFPLARKRQKTHVNINVSRTRDLMWKICTTTWSPKEIRPGVVNCSVFSMVDCVDRFDKGDERLNQR